MTFTSGNPPYLYFRICYKKVKNTMYSFYLRKFAAHLSENAMENLDKVHLFTPQSVENLVT